MKRKLRFVFVIAMTIAMGTVVVRGTEEQEETFGDKLKKLFVRPSPTPKHRKKKKTSPTPSVTPSPPANETPTSPPSGTPIAPSPSVRATATAQPSETPPPAPSAVEIRTPIRTGDGQTQYFEAVRPISPRPRSRRNSTPKIIAAPKTPIPTVTMTPTPVEIPVQTPSPTETPVSRPAPSLPPMIKPAASPSSSPIAKKAITPNATISTPEVTDSQSYSPEVKKVIDLGLNLATQHLGYKYASADPAKGGMDCSGFIYYVLSQSGIKDVPRDAREQYIWVRKAGNFQAVLAQRDDSFELDALKPGDLLFWASNYGVSRDPDITQTMIYLGREKGTNQRIMIGASERLAYKGQSRSGVNVFDFKVARAKPKSNNELGPIFVGYGRVPGLGK